MKLNVKFVENSFVGMIEPEPVGGVGTRESSISRDEGCRLLSSVRERISQRWRNKLL